jgi:hypothetical protein
MRLELADEILIRVSGARPGRIGEDPLFLKSENSGHDKRADYLTGISCKLLAALLSLRFPWL